MLAEGRVRQHLHGAGSRLIALGFGASLVLHKLCEAFKVSTAIVIFGFVTLAIEPLQGRETLNSKPPTEVFVFVGVDFPNRNFIRGGSERLSELLIDRGEILAVTTPRGKEFHQGWFARVENYIVEVRRDKVEDFGACANQRRQ